jgi:hypothetical protein
MKLPLRPDLLLDTKYPTNIAIQQQDLSQRLDLLERFYGVVTNHDALGNLTSDSHLQYPLGASDRSAYAMQGYTNVKYLGAVGDGVNDDTDAVH